MQLPSLLVPLDREFIQRNEFPSSRRGGWDPAAVEAHLRAVADEVQLLRRAAEAPTGDPLAAAASAQVRAIVAAAEVGAAELRDEASADARDHVARIAEAAQALLERIDAYGRELDEIMAGVRAGAARLAAEVAALDGEAGEPEIRGAPPLTPSAVRMPEAEEPELDAGGENGEGLDEEETGARMVALDMALGGTSREDTERYLAEHFGELADPRQLLDDVYARAGR
jgi:hypothetical protein